ncbi:hypothetical protein PsYK624_058760 [Phanerochaete sordida]|uniref:Uncharacterized protein n=1 Tax=Phanerochaete sordida TaxID=48140 RepID=A0A9P3LCN7_9APHY|nr:hypothetical protein PsYK624_058760 [Phanerochaete sordida]
MKVNVLYPNLTDAHLKRLKFYPENRNGYQQTNEGCAEGAVEWLSIRVRNGWSATDSSNALTGDASTSVAVDTQEGTSGSAKKRTADSAKLKDGDKGKKVRR